jgi:hypothetical protein
MNLKKIKLALLFLSFTFGAFAQKGKFHIGLEGGLSLPAGSYAYDYYALPGFNSNLELGYYVSSNMRIGLNLGLTNHSFDAQGLAEYTLRTAEPSQFNEEPISASVTTFDNYQNLLIAGTYAVTFPVKTKAYFDIKVFLGVDLFYDGGAEITTYFDDYPYLQNMREEVYIESASSIAFYSGVGLGFRWKFNEKISAGISLDLAYANLSYPQNFTWESLDDTGTYDFNFGTIDNTYKAIWINTNGGIYFTLGKGK